ncbi:MAG TPA: hypothetical protein VFH58_15100 [Acidimicrobiales bacterium]|nr:hypothetical protein [Acidimicrobiales bacterium]
MPDVRRFLRLLRPAAAPGAAAAVGVPADRRTELETELAPVFAALADVEAECTAIREAAARDASRITAEAAADAERVRADAAVLAPAVQEEAFEQGRHAAEKEARRILARARREAVRVSDDAAGRIPLLTADVAAAVRRMGGTGGGR